MEYKPDPKQISQFIATYNSDSARKHCRFSLSWFEFWYNEQWLTNNLNDINEKNIYTVLQMFVKFLEQEKTINEKCTLRAYKPGEIVGPFSVPTVKSYMAYLRTWLAHLGIKTDDREYRRLVRRAKQLKEIKYTPDLTMVQKMIYGIMPKYQNFLVMLLSTAARQSEVIKLKVSDVDFSKSPFAVHFPAQITKTRSERYSFLTKEAGEYVKKQAQGKQENDLLFPEINLNTFRYVFQNLRKKVNFDVRYSTGTHKLTPHRLRAYSNRILQRETDPAFADVILGHADGLATYDADNIEKMREDYSKAEPMLTVSPEIRMQSQKTANDRMQAEIDRLKFELQNIKDGFGKSFKP